MFILTAKVRRSRLIAGLALLALGIGLVVAGTGLVQSIRNHQGMTPAQVSVKGIKTNQDRIDYLARFGWEVEKDPVSTEEVLIPQELGPSFDEYLALQTRQGYSLADYAGKTVMRYTYAVTNYPGISDNVWASLLIYKKTVIAAELTSSRNGGFLRGLDDAASA